MRALRGMLSGSVIGLFLVFLPCCGDPTKVTGTQVTHYLTQSGQQDVPADLAQSPISAWTLDDSGNLVPVPVTVTGAGRFELPISQGTTFYVQAGSTAIVTTARQLDLGTDVLGRPNTTHSYVGDVTFSANWSGMTPSSGYDGFSLFCLGTGGSGGLYPSSPLPQGDTRLTQSITYEPGLNAGLMDAAQGDTAIVAQWQWTMGSPSNGGTYLSIMSAFTSGPVSMTPGTPQPLNGTFQPLPRKTVNADLRIPQFAGLAGALHPQATYLVSDLVLSGVPSGGRRGVVGEKALVSWDSDSSRDMDANFPLSYGNPYPSEWGEIATLTAYYLEPVQLPGVARGSIYLHVSRQGAPADLFSSPVMPEVGPPGDLTVDGVPAQQQRVLTSAQPVLAWSEPSLGLSRAYQVRVVELYRSSLDGTTRGRDVYKIYTSARSVRIPPNVLHSGKSYVLVVGSMANVSGPFNVDTAPFYSHGSLDLAESATSMLTVP